MSVITKPLVDDCISRLKTNIFDGILSKIKNVQERDKIKTWARFKVDAFLASTNMYREEEFQLALMWFYIQMKAEWSQLNTHAQYQQMRGFLVNQSYSIRMSILSIIIKEIENHINLYHVDGVTSFLSLPMNLFEREPFYAE